MQKQLRQRGGDARQSWQRKAPAKSAASFFCSCDIPPVNKSTDCPDEQSVCNEFLNNGIRKDRLRCVDGLVQRCFPQSFFRLAGSTSTKSSLFLTSRGNELKLVKYDISNINNAESACIKLL